MQFNDIAQIIIACTLAIAVIAAIILVYRRGLKIGWKRGAIDLTGKNGSGIIIHLNDLEMIMDIMIDSVMMSSKLCLGVRLERKMAFAQEKITGLRGLKEQMFFSALKAKGVPQNMLAAHPDAQYYIQVLGNALYYDNGTQSLISQIRRNLRAEEYRESVERSETENRNKYDEFISAFLQAAMQRWKRFFMDNYRSDVMDEEGIIRKRIISFEDLYDMDFSVDRIAEVRKIIDEIYQYAKEVDANIDEEKKVVDEKRKEKIKQIVNMRQGGRGGN